ncbi:MAG: dihydropteroate synthase [Hyphomonas sp.]|uniref:dihydropteroate synthase n=1 Tax=Hyphomonas sp. TaxID=87 RepID=UPI0034A0A61B
MDKPARHRQRDQLLRRLAGERALIMGILNVTPDSFSDGGRFGVLSAALKQARQMTHDGADIIDIGGESTRPGAAHVIAGAEWERVSGAVAALAEEFAPPVSIDTYKAEVARKAAEAGAVMINDVWGLTRDPGMADVVAETGSLAVITYNRGAADPGLDLRADMAAFVSESFARAGRAGIPREHILFDPGAGFAKTYEQNFAALAHLDVLVDTGCPVLVGVSRKSFIGKLSDRTVDRRLGGTLAAGLFSLQRGAKVLRVHDVAEHSDALDMQFAIKEYQ